MNHWGNSMNVLLITLLKKGGMVHYTSQLANNLSKLVKVTVIVPEECSPTYFNERINIKKVKTPPQGSWFSRDQFNIFKLFKMINDEKPDIIHISGSYIWVIGLYFFLKINKYPTVVTVHDVNPHYGEDTSMSKFINYFYIKIADHVFVHGEKLKKELLKKGINEKNVSAIPLGDFSFFTKYTKDNVKEDGSILFFGRIEDYKGLEYLLKAVPLIEKAIDNPNIIIAGRGYLNKYNHLIEGKSNIEIFNKYIEDELVAELFQRANVVVMPYVEGSQSGIIPIAYSFKKPVIVTNVGSISEVVDDGINGYIIPPKDFNALAKAIINILLDDALRKEMGENSYKKMKCELSWDNISKRTVETYKKIIEV